MADDDRGVRETRQMLLDRMAVLMLDALKEKAGVHLNDKQWYLLREKLADTLRGEITL